MEPAVTSEHTAALVTAGTSDTIGGPPLMPSSTQAEGILVAEPSYQAAGGVASGQDGAASSVQRRHALTYQQLQRERQRQRFHAQRRRRSQMSLVQWVWVKVCYHIRRSTVEFFEALDSGRVEGVRAMARAQPVLLLRTRPGSRWTAVHLCAERGEYAMLTALFEEADVADSQPSAVKPRLLCVGSAGADTYVSRMVNALTEKNLTALMLACKRGHPSTTTYLMSRGSNPCIADREGAKMAIHYACLYGHWACTQVMMEPRWVVPLATGPQPLLHALISDMHGENRYIDARTCAGLTPLHMAAWAGHVEVAKILLQHGAQLNSRIVFSSPSTSSVLPGSTPTHLATRKNRIHVVKVLLTAYLDRKRQAEREGREPEEDPRTIPDDRGNYAVMHAISRGNNSMAALLDANADLETILATDLNQLGQVPKLQALAMSALRSHLLVDLECLLSAGKAGKRNAAPAPAKRADSSCAGSDILDGSPTTPQPFDRSAAAKGRRLSGQLPGQAEEEPLDVMGWERGSRPASPVEHHFDDLCCSTVHLHAGSSECGSAGEVMCGICMEEAESVALTRCDHRLCGTCARQLLVVAASSSCQCPFCRKYIGGFMAVPKGEAKR